MGKEAKVGLAVILILLITFGVVLARRLSGPAEPPQASASAEKVKGTSGARSNPTSRQLKAKTAEAGTSKPTVVAAKAISRKMPKQSPDEIDQFRVVSDSRTATASPTPNTIEVSPPSFMPNPPAPVSADPYDRYGTPQQSTSASGTWKSGGSMSDSAEARRTAKPFSNPIRQMPSADGQFDRAPNTLEVPTPTSPVGQYSTSNTSAIAGSQFGNADVALEDGEYQVQPNDSYWIISEKLYGCGVYFKALAEHNRGRVTQEDRLVVGDVISAPSIEQLEKTYPGLCPKASRREMIRRRASAVSTRGQYTGGRTYVVEEGDNLFDIARYELGKASRWVEIYQLNRELLGEDYDYLTPGLQLVLPDGESADTVTRRPLPSSPYRR